MNHEQGCAECTDWGNGNCASGCFEPICTCTELQRATVCHDISKEPHVLGCPRWGMPNKGPRKVVVLHMVYPDGTHTGDCEGCLWSQAEGAL